MPEALAASPRCGAVQGKIVFVEGKNGVGTLCGLKWTVEVRSLVWEGGWVRWSPFTCWAHQGRWAVVAAYCRLGTDRRQASLLGQLTAT